MVTVEELKKSHWIATLFMDGDDPKHLQAYDCKEFPRLKKTAIKPKHGGWRVVYTVDGEEIVRDADIDGWLQRIVDALNKKPAEETNEQHPESPRGA